MSASANNGAAPASVWFAASAPASSANLGCAFDCAAIALNLRQRAKASLRVDQSFLVKYSGPDSARVPCDASNLVVQGILQFAAAHSAEISGASVEIENEIPVGVGLGSSAAAIVCGLLLGAALLGVEPASDEILNLAAKIEGHPDNAAAAVHGGLVFAATVEDESTQKNARVICACTLLPAGLKLIAIVPPTPTSTRAARAVLPQQYSRADVVHNLQRASLLAALCFSGSAALDLELFRDRIHQPYRVPSVPGLAECLAITHPDLLGVCLSGSGSAALAFVRGSEQEIGALLAAPFAQRGPAPTALILKNEPRGAEVETVLANAREKSTVPAATLSTEKSPCKS
jgi:homoserine kinase